MKAILISIKPPHVANILNLIKTLEIRKKFPKDYVGWVYIYCTKEKGTYLYGDKSVYEGKKETFWCQRILGNGIVPLLNGKVVARFWCDKVEEIDDCFTMEHIGNEYPDTYELGAMEEEQLLKECCLTKEEMNPYYKGIKKPLKAIHITKLEIFDNPKEISEFKHTIKKHYYNADFDYEGVEEITLPLTRAPQSWCWIEV